MFKNRVRTAALAGAIAVATGVSGLAVPAYAQQGGTGHNVEDGSKPGAGENQQNQPPVGEVLAANKLRDDANKNEAAIKAHVFLPVRPFAESLPIEAETKAKFDAKEQQATALLTASVKNLNDINVTLKDIEEQIKKANDAWRAYADATTLTAAERQELRDLAVRVKAPADIIEKIDALDVVTAKPGDENYIEQIFDISTSPDSRQKVYELVDTVTGYQRTDEGTEEELDQSKAVSQVAKQLFTFLDGWDDRNKLWKRANELTADANDRNVAVVREAFTNAQENVRAARLLVAYYSTAARWVDLYNKDTLLSNEERTLRTEYFNLLFNSNNGSTVGNQNRWNLDLEAAAQAAVTNADAGQEWVNPVETVRLLDKKYRTDYPDRWGAAKPDYNAPSDADRLIDALDKITDDNGKPGNPPAGENPTPPGSSVPGSSNPGLGTAGIIVGVLAVIGGIIAAIFPHIQQFLPKF
ncbi:hypothetical protein [Corynebacterium timonense]|uniref:Uncharacterized protein n=1 Tax=Corynebacterium timonense TaxID=441500 RepID=A0A1H1L0U6_9CORY|nr:hypothetical protein [Corynebacterium timonense]SDR68228.1 hypothetical protein SAMN04488539_0012 [Corynebacterium timonense]